MRALVEGWNNETIRADQMKIGQIGKVVVGLEKEFNTHLLLRTYSGIVDLSNPHQTWSVTSGNCADGMSYCSLRVVVLPPETKVVLVVDR